MSSTTPPPIRVQRRHAVYAALAVALGLAGCSDSSGAPERAPAEPDVPAPAGSGGSGDGGSGADGPPRDITPRFGQVVISESTEMQDAPVSRVAARFVALTPAASAHAAMLQRAADSCDRVSEASTVPGVHDVDGTAPAGSELLIAQELTDGELDAGETITLTSPEGTWSTLLPADVGSARVYLNSADGSRVEGRIPSGLVIDIPGGSRFPAFASVAMPDPQPGADSFVPAIGSPVDVTTEYRWRSSSATGSRIHLALKDESGRLDCFAADDGLFTLGEASLGGDALDGDATLLGVAREATRIERMDDATLVLTVATERP